MPVVLDQALDPNGRAIPERLAPVAFRRAHSTTVRGAAPRRSSANHDICRTTVPSSSDQTPESIVGSMKGDRVEAMVDTGQGVQTFEIVASRAGRRIEVVTSRGVVEVREVTRTGVPVRTGRFMTSRLIALVEHPAIDERGRVEVTTRHRLQVRERP